MQELRLVFHRPLIFALFLAILLTAGQAQATITSYGSRALFDAAVPAPLVENWDSFSNGDIISGTVNGITYTYVPDIIPYSRENVDFQVTSLYAYTTRPNTLGLTGTPSYFTYDGIRFGFSTPIRAFGIDISTFAPTDGTFKATTDMNDVVYSHFNYFPDYGTGQFLGFTSTEDIYWVTLALTDPDNNNNAFSFTLDTLRYQPIPLPPSLLLLGSGLAGLGLLRLRNRKRFKS